jgi:dihydrofolate reductase
MGKLIVFNTVSLDGYFTDENGDMSWAYQGSDDPEYNEFVRGNASGDGMLVFGRITYELMTRYWPTPMAMEQNPNVAERMNSARKIVFSRTLKSADWKNTTLVKTDPAAEIRRLKQDAGADMAILGSGTIVSQVAQERLVDEFQIVVHPIVLGKGRSMFAGVRDRLPVKPMKTRSFHNGKVFMSYSTGL